MRIIRDGVDIGYYSSVHDDDIFRAESEKATGPPKKELLQQHLDDLTVSFYRDPKRQNVDGHQFQSCQHVPSATRPPHVTAFTSPSMTI